MTGTFMLMLLTSFNLYLEQECSFVVIGIDLLESPVVRPLQLSISCPAIVILITEPPHHILSAPRYFEAAHLGHAAVKSGPLGAASQVPGDAAGRGV